MAMRLDTRTSHILLVTSTKAGLMGHKLRKGILSALLAGLAAVVMAPSADAARRTPPTTEPPSYVPDDTYGNTPTTVTADLYGDETVPGAEDLSQGGNNEATTEVSVLGGEGADPGADLAGGNQPLGPVG